MKVICGKFKILEVNHMLGNQRLKSYPRETCNRANHEPELIRPLRVCKADTHDWTVRGR